MAGDSSALELEGRTAVVTGASSGIGQAIAVELAAGGADVLVHARANVQDAQQAVDAIAALGRNGRVLQIDLSNRARLESFVDEAWQWQGNVDIWVNNAGADVLTGEAAKWAFEQKLETLWNVDVFATMILSRAVGRRMKQHAGRDSTPVILNMGWDQAEHGMAGDSGEMFATVKGAVAAFTKSLAQSLAPQVRVNCLAPGWIKTAWGERASDRWQEVATRQSLLGRWGTPQDVARTARFLASPAASFITGQVIAVNGGFRRGRD